MSRKTKRTQRANEGMRIVDVDVHVNEDVGELARYCEMPWKRALLASKAATARYLDVPGLSPPTADDYCDPLFPSPAYREVKTPQQMRKDLDELGIHDGVLFPDHLLKLAIFPQPEYAMALAKAYNRMLINDWLGKEDGLHGALCIAPQDPRASAEEIVELGKTKHIVCVYLPVAGLQRLYGQREYDPIYEVAQKLDIPLVLHGVSAVHPVFPFQLEQYPNLFSRHGLAHPLGMIANLTHMIATGVPVRFPKLKVCFAEGAISWVPWIMMRLDKEYIERRREVPFLEERPSHYIRKFRFATQPIEEPERPSHYAKLLEIIDNPDCILFASDWPHHDFDHPSKLMGYPIPEEWKRKIMGENAVRFFNLDKW